MMSLTVLYDWGGLNSQLFKIINAVHDPLIDWLMQIGTNLGNFKNALWVVLLLLILLAARRVTSNATLIPWLPSERHIVHLLMVFLLGYAVAVLLVSAGKVGFDMPRPYMALPPGTVNVLAAPESPYSFPSGHSAFAMLCAWVLWPYCSRRWRGVLVVGTIWVGISRMSVGVHFPADIMAGYFCGAASGWFARRLSVSFRKCANPLWAYWRRMQR